MRNTNTKANFIAWYRDMFGFTLQVSTALYDKQLLRNEKTLVKLDNCDVNNICHTIWHNPNKPIPKVAATWFKLAIFWIKHQDRTSRKIGMIAKPLVCVTLDTILILKEQRLY